jgi:uncharacterized protein YodC (DUF2158 family)
MINLFKVGDVVIAKGQSVKMCISEIPADNVVERKYTCQWFDNENHLHSDLFDEASLTTDLK